MSNPNNLFPDETSGAQPSEANPPIPELPIKPSPQQQTAFSRTPPVSGSPAQSLEVAKSSAHTEQVDEGEKLPRESPDQTLAYVLGKINDLIQWFAIVVELTLGLRFLLKLIGASPTNVFASFIYALTNVILLPFAGLINNPSLHPDQAFEWTTLIAMGIYATIFWLITRLIRISISSPEVNRVEATVIRSAINNTSYSNYQQLAKAITHRIGATDERLIESSSLVGNTAWEIFLPKIGLRLDTGKAILFLRHGSKPCDTIEQSGSEGRIAQSCQPSGIG